MSGFALSRGTAEWLKGVAIVLMLAHHLFGLPSLIVPPNDYWPLIPGVPLEYWIGRFGKICVGMFLVLSGYGFAVSGAGRGYAYFAGKALRFWLQYWPYFLIALILGHLFFQERMDNGSLRFPADLMGLVLNALTLKNTMAYEWWFAETYLLLVLLTGLLLRVASYRCALLAGSCVAFGIGAMMDAATPKLDTPVVSLANLLIWQWPWVMGILLAGNLPNWLAGCLANRSFAVALLVAIVALFALVERFAGFAMTPFLIAAAPGFIVALTTIGVAPLRAGVLRWLGGYTLGLWLVHPFFCYYFFQAEIFSARWSPLVFAALLLASLAVVWPVEWVRGRIMR